MNYTVRRLKKGEADLYRDIRLASLRESPEAFATTYESALSRSPESWVAQADATASGSDRATFVIISEHPIGLGALYRDPNHPNEGELLQFWVSSEYRGSTVALALLEAILNWAGYNGFEVIRAEVTKNNLRALRFYEKHGFNRTDPQQAPDEGNCILIKQIEQRVESGA